jgi:hypothetical protein
MVAGCGNGAGANEHTANTGAVTMPLTTSTNGVNYRLTNVTVSFEGATFASVSETNPDEAVLSTTLSTGNWTAFLTSFALEKDDGTGNFQPVSATPENTVVSFIVYDGATTTIEFRFQTDGVIVVVGSGSVNVVTGVDTVPSACTPLGTDCPTGTWCPPSGLTGQPIACVPAGAVAIGQPCTSPADCVANASCFDAGSGPVCTALCSTTAACAGGATCLPAGTDYGICGTPGGDAGSGLPSCSGTPPGSPQLLGTPGSAGGGTYGYAAPGLVAPTVSTAVTAMGDTQILVSENPGTTTDPTNAFTGFGIYFLSCVDASAFTGVEFTVTGSLGTCALNFGVTQSDDGPVSNSGANARCTAATCISPSGPPIGTGTTVVHFSDLGMGTPDPRATPGSLIGINWNLEVPTDGVTAPCVANITVSGISFTND